MSLRDALAVAARQHGLITADQAAEAGLALHKARYLVDSGHWERRAKGLFAITGSPRTYEQDVMAACLATNGLAVASHGCAARLLGLGLPAFADAAPAITIPRGTSGSRAQALGVAVHTTRHLTAADWGRTNGIPVTRAARLVVDLLGEVPATTLYAVADDVLWRLRDRREIHRVWQRAGGNRHRRTLDAALLPWTPGPKPGSPKEMSLCRVLMLHGLPRPVRQHELTVNGRRRFLDLAYPDFRVAIEYDGRRDHGPRQWGADAEREDELWSIGWVRLPAGRLDLVEPHATAYCEVVRAAMATTVREAAAR
jgi:Transcriptional regulator, AbiEi antitoxin